MSDGAQNICREIQAIEALNNFLVDDICNRLFEVDARFRGFINMMAQTGIPIQECTRFSQEFYAVDKANFETLHNQILNNDLPAIAEYVKQLVRQFQAATGSSYGGVSLHRPSGVPMQTPSDATQRRSDVQDYEVQIDAICDFMGYLVSERDTLNDTIMRYEGYCNNMVENGVPIQIVNHYVPNCAVPNVNQIKKTISHVESEDYKQLSALFSEIADSMSALGNSPSRSPRAM